MPRPDGAGRRLVHAVLAAQAAALRARIEEGAVLDLLGQTTDRLAQLSDEMAALLREHAAVDPILRAQFEAAVQVACAIGGNLDQYAFMLAQQQDSSRQMANCMAVALQRMVAAEISPNDLMPLYVSEDQRRVHEDVVSQFGLGRSQMPEREESAE